uniref:ATP-dependent nuclease n=1 Tax=Lactococcus garvieae TaxID=1363 RepID=UPI00359C2E4F
MYISKIRLVNFRCFEGKEELIFCPGVNYFVGNNNSGKTTVFKAIEFLKFGKTKDGWITKGKEDEEITVEIIIKGNDLKDFLEKEDLKKYKPYLINNTEIILRRSSEVTTWKDSRGKTKEISIRNISVYNPQNNIFENPTGADNMISALFDAQFVYSDLNNEDFQKFGKSTTIVGKLINVITKDFQKSDKWKNFEAAHSDTFGDAGLVGTLNKLQDQVEEIMENQYGKTKVEFSFGIPTIDNFFKTGQILLEDNGIKTEASEKGTGMQRALALTLIQVYSQIDESETEVSKPVFFFIDEPETFLHPTAQNKLLKSLNKISEKNQVFITTHSSYLLKNFNASSNKLCIFSRNEDYPRIIEDVSLNMFPHSPTWGEINYRAFHVASVEFHIELFGFLHKKAIQEGKTYNNGQNTVCKSISSFDKWLIEQDSSLIVDDNHQNVFRNNTDQSMSTYIRNYLDHPGEDNSLPKGKYRNPPTTEEIKNSIESMLNILEENF